MFLSLLLTMFCSAKLLEKHMKIYTAINHEQAVQLCGENVYSKFVKFKRLLKISFLIYADFESTVVP